MSEISPIRRKTLFNQSWLAAQIAWLRWAKSAEYVGPSLTYNFNSGFLYVCPTLALHCKTNKIKCTAFLSSSSTWWCWVNVAPTLCTQRQLLGPNYSCYLVEKWFITTKVHSNCFKKQLKILQKFMRLERRVLELINFKTISSFKHYSDIRNRLSTTVCASTSPTYTFTMHLTCINAYGTGILKIYRCI